MCVGAGVGQQRRIEGPRPPVRQLVRLVHLTGGVDGGADWRRMQGWVSLDIQVKKREQVKVEASTQLARLVT